MIVGVLLCILLFALAAWVFQIRISAERRREGLDKQSEEREEQGEEEKEQEEGGREGFNIRKFINSTKQRIQDEINRRKRQMEDLINQQRKRAEEARARILAEERELNLKALTAKWSNLLASDFRNLDLLPKEVADRLQSEITSARRRKQEFEEEQELLRKQKARKVINYILQLVDKLPDTPIVLELVSILEGNDKNYDIYSLKKHSNQPSSYVGDLLQLLRQQPIDSARIKQVAIMLNEFDCGKNDFCYARTDQWLYDKKR